MKQNHESTMDEIDKINRKKYKERSRELIQKFNESQMKNVFECISKENMSNKPNGSGKTNNSHTQDKVIESHMIKRVIEERENGKIDQDTLDRFDMQHI